MSVSRRTWRSVAAAAALAAAACRDSTGPTFSNPQQLSADLQSVSSVFLTPTFQSFGAIGAAPGSPVPASAPAGALLATARIAAPQFARQPYADAPARLQALRSAASAVGSPLSADVIPSPLWGKTYVWDAVTTHGYVEDPAQFDQNRQGVRIILYQVDNLGQVTEPPVAVGFLDLLDESVPGTDQLHVIVAGGTPANPGIEYANYVVTGRVTLSGTGVVTGFDATAVGDVGDGTRQVHFNATFSATNLDTDNPDAQVDVTWELNAPQVSIALHETLAAADVNNVLLTINFSVTRGGETVSLAGTVAVDALAQTVTANLTVSIGTEPLAYIRGTNETIDARRAQGGGLLSQAELAAVLSLFGLPDHLFAVIEDLVHPCESLMGA
jgi:hypothetical protein